MPKPHLTLAERVRRMGPYTGVRYMANHGVPFEVAHWLMLGCAPRFA